MPTNWPAATDPKAPRALALTDVLTGLNNRRGFFVQAEHMFKLARRKQAGCAVIYADIDGLKLVNDQLGHAAGDQLIQDAASVLRESLRDSDVLARFGGDEFVAFALDDAHPRVILARLQDNLRAFNLMQDRAYLLAVSAGAVQCARQRHGIARLCAVCGPGDVSAQAQLPALDECAEVASTSVPRIQTDFYRIAALSRRLFETPRLSWRRLCMRRASGPVASAGLVSCWQVRDFESCSQGAQALIQRPKPCPCRQHCRRQ